MLAEGSDLFLPIGAQNPPLGLYILILSAVSPQLFSCGLLSNYLVYRLSTHSKHLPRVHTRCHPSSHMRISGAPLETSTTDLPASQLRIGDRFWTCLTSTADMRPNTDLMMWTYLHFLLFRQTYWISQALWRIWWLEWGVQTWYIQWSYMFACDILVCAAWHKPPSAVWSTQ